MLEENSTWTATCAASSLQAANGSGLPPDVDVTVRVIQATYIIFQSTIGVMLNGLIVLLIVISKKLRNVSFATAIQIAIGSLVLISSNLLTVFNIIAGRWIMGLPFCIINGFLSFMLNYIRSMLVFVFSLDRFALIFVPFNYSKYSKRVVTVLCVLFWCVSFITPLVIIPPFLDCYQYIESVSSCTYSRYCSSNCEIFTHQREKNSSPSRQPDGREYGHD